MTTAHRDEPGQRARRSSSITAACLLALGLAACGGDGSNPIGNPPEVSNPVGVTGQKLSFAYFQKCINPIFVARLQINIGGAISTNTCAGSGCHDNTTGTGGALRVVANAQPVDLTNPANTPEVIRTTDMYKNFYSAQGSVVIGAVTQSRLLTKPLVLNVLHGGGLIFEDLNDSNAVLMQYWMTHPAPNGQDEFSTATYSMFTPADLSGTCNTR
jgi:hypothetical protein